MALTKSEHLHTHCLKRKYCALALFPREPGGEAAKALHALMRQYRHVAFATVNTARYDLSLAKHLPAPADPKQPQLVAFRSSEVTAAADGDDSDGATADDNADATAILPCAILGPAATPLLPATASLLWATSLRPASCTAPLSRATRSSVVYGRDAMEPICSSRHSWRRHRLCRKHPLS